MRKFSVVIMLSIMALVQGCTTITTKSVPVEKVVNVDNEKQNEIYIKANNWMVDTFNNADSVVQFTDKESGTISGRYLLGTVMTKHDSIPARYAYATIKIRVKDGATKITIKPEPFSYPKGHPYTLYTEEDAQRDINSLITSFEKSMNKVEDNNW